MKAHQAWVVDAVAITQEIPSGRRFPPFAVEAQLGGDFLLRRLVTVRRVRDAIGIARVDLSEYRVFKVHRQQHSTLLARVCWVVRFGLSHTKHRQA